MKHNTSHDINHQHIKCKRFIQFDDRSGEGDVLHLIQGYIPTIEFHNPGSIYTLAEK